MTTALIEKPKVEIPGLSFERRDQLDKLPLEEALIGLSPTVAHAYVGTRGNSVRVAIREGCECMITADHRPFRLNVATKNDLIIEYLGRG